MLPPGDCSCTSGVQTGNAVPCLPPTGAVVADARYFTLQTAPQGQALVVPKGSNTQAFWKPTGARGFAWYQDEELKLSTAPQLTLPVINPASGGVHPVPSGGFKYLTIGSGDPADWRMVAAPTGGNYVLQAVNGSWVLADAGSIPGINAVGNDPTTIQKGAIVALVNIGSGGSPQWVLRRVTAVPDRVLVGDQDNLGNLTYTALATNKALNHPIGQFDVLRSRQFVTVDSNGTLVPNGLAQAQTTGLGAITDGKQVIYSTAQSGFFFAPAQTSKFTQVTQASPTTTPATDWSAMPSGHGAGLNLNYNYPKVLVMFNINFAGAESIDVALYLDGSPLQTWELSSTGNVTLFYTNEASPLGGHVYDWRYRKHVGGGSGTFSIKQSCMQILTLP